MFQQKVFWKHTLNRGRFFWNWAGLGNIFFALNIKAIITDLHEFLRNFTDYKPHKTEKMP